MDVSLLRATATPPWYRRHWYLLVLVAVAVVAVLWPTGEASATAYYKTPNATYLNGRCSYSASAGVDGQTITFAAHGSCPLSPTRMMCATMTNGSDYRQQCSTKGNRTNPILFFCEPGTVYSLHADVFTAGTSFRVSRFGIPCGGGGGGSGGW